MVERRMQYIVHSNTINLTKFNYSATIIVGYIYKDNNGINFLNTSYKHRFNE